MRINIENLQLLAMSEGGVIDILPLTAYVMKQCGASYREIGEVFAIPRQLAEYHVKQVESKIESIE